MALHATHQVGVVAAGADRVLDRDAVGPVELRIVVALEATHHVGGNEGQHARAGGLRDIFAETRKGQHRGAALIDHRRDARANADHVGVEAEAATDVAVDMGMGVDQAGQHQLAADIDRLARRARQGLANGSDASIADGDIEETIEVLRWIDDAAAAQDEIIGRELHHSSWEVGPLSGRARRFASPVPGRHDIRQHTDDPAHARA